MVNREESWVRPRIHVDDVAELDVDRPVRADEHVVGRPLRARHSRRHLSRRHKPTTTSKTLNPAARNPRISPQDPTFPRPRDGTRPENPSLTPQEPESLPNLSESPLDSPAGTAKAVSFPSIWSAGAAADRARPWRTVRALGGFGADLSREAGGIGWRILRGGEER